MNHTNLSTRKQIGNDDSIVTNWLHNFQRTSPIKPNKLEYENLCETKFITGIEYPSLVY